MSYGPFRLANSVMERSNRFADAFPCSAELFLGQSIGHRFVEPRDGVDDVATGQEIDECRGIRRAIGRGGHPGHGKKNEERTTASTDPDRDASGREKGGVSGLGAGDPDCEASRSCPFASSRSSNLPNRRPAGIARIFPGCYVAACCHHAVSGSLREGAKRARTPIRRKASLRR